MIGKILDYIIDNGFGVHLWIDGNIFVSGQLSKHDDGRGLALYDIDVDQFIFRAHELRRIEFHGDVVNLYYGF